MDIKSNVLELLMQVKTADEESRCVLSQVIDALAASGTAIEYRRTEQKESNIPTEDFEFNNID